jgi:hypothetical protein
MSATMTNSTGRRGDHFEPEAALDPHEQRKMRAHLEQIDYAAFAANRKVLAQALGKASLASFERLAIAAARARAQWVHEAIGMTANAGPLSVEQAARLATLRHAFEELTEAYEAMRRMVERGYLNYQAAPPV